MCSAANLNKTFTWLEFKKICSIFKDFERITCMFKYVDIQNSHTTQKKKNMSDFLGKFKKD